jgi:hypothetical protein|nr:MAG TPA: hypothetical protein [Caudoviricetes sp.]
MGSLLRLAEHIRKEINILETSPCKDCSSAVIIVILLVVSIRNILPKGRIYWQGLVQKTFGHIIVKNMLV